MQNELHLFILKQVFKLLKNEAVYNSKTRKNILGYSVVIDTKIS